MMSSRFWTCSGWSAATSLARALGPFGVSTTIVVTSEAL